MQGAPCSTTLHLTFLALQHWHALLALLFTARPFAFVFPLAPVLDLRLTGFGALSDGGEALELIDGGILADSRAS